MAQTVSRAVPGAAADGRAGRAERDGSIGFDVIGDASRYAPGFDATFVAQPEQQKKYSTPSWPARAAACAGSTLMPQTGSRATLTAGSGTPRVRAGRGR